MYFQDCHYRSYGLLVHQLFSIFLAQVLLHAKMRNKGPAQYKLHPKMRNKGSTSFNISYYTGQRKDWISNLIAYWLVQWCTYPKNETLVHQQVWESGAKWETIKWSLCFLAHFPFIIQVCGSLPQWCQVGAMQRREDMTSRCSDNLHALITFQGQESWMQVTKDGSMDEVTMGA